MVLLIDMVIILGVVWFWKYMDKLIDATTTKKHLMNEDLPLEMIDELDIETSEDFFLPGMPASHLPYAMWVVIEDADNRVIAISEKKVDLQAAFDFETGSPTVEISNVVCSATRTGVAVSFTIAAKTIHGFHRWVGPYPLNDVTKNLYVGNKLTLEKVMISLHLD